MKKLHKFLALAALTPFLAACTPSNADVCNHIMDIMKKEFGDAEGAKAPSEEDMKKATEKCVTEMDKEKASVGEEKFNEQVKCAMAAQKLDDLTKCKKEEDEKKAE